MHSEQLSFLMPLGMTLNPHNRWVLLSRLVPWDVAEPVYAAHFAGRKGGPDPLPVRIALGALIIKERLDLTDRETVEQIRENPYLQYFLGRASFTDEALFDHTMISTFRRRLGMDCINQINAALIERALSVTPEAPDDDDAHDDDGSMTAPVDDHGDGGDSAPQASPPTGCLMIDATCAPADITFPTDLKILNNARALTEEMIDILHKPFIGQRPRPRTYRRNGRHAFLRAAKAKRLSRSKRRTAVGKQLRFLRRNLGVIAHFVAETPDCLLRLHERLYTKMLVIHEVFRQQWIMYETHTYRISDRIVSIAQPHVRPQVRGKAHAPTEFGAKISASVINGFASLDRLSWDAYHEASDLPQQAARYRQRTGHYPARVLADKIYRTRANRKWCTERGIRLAGIPPGRPPADPARYRQQQRDARNDEAERQPIEGVFGRAKRRYGLSRIMAKTAVTAAASIALIFLVMNLERLLLLCALLFAHALLCRNLWPVLTSAWRQSALHKAEWQKRDHHPSWGWRARWQGLAG